MTDIKPSEEYYRYFAAIEEFYQRELGHGRSKLLSPADWVLIEEWSKKGIPLNEIVLPTMRRIKKEYYENRFSPHRNIHGIRYFNEAILEAFEAWQIIAKG